MANIIYFLTFFNLKKNNAILFSSLQNILKSCFKKSKIIIFLSIQPLACYIYILIYKYTYCYIYCYIYIFLHRRYYLTFRFLRFSLAWGNFFNSKGKGMIFLNHCQLTFNILTIKRNFFAT